jgi:hypothetical protein
MLVTVSSHINPTEAHIMRCRLEADGIDAYVAHEHHVGLYWLQATALGGAKVQVDADDAGAATEIVGAVERGEYALPDTAEDAKVCPGCGSSDVLPDKTTWRISMLSILLLSFPLPFSRRRLRCLACGHAGKDLEFSGSEDV